MMHILRWIILGDPKFKEERTLTWVEQIDPSLQAMHWLAPGWTDPENKTRLKAIEKEIDDFRIFQQQVEDIAQTPGNIMSGYDGAGFVVKV